MGSGFNCFKGQKGNTNKRYGGTQNHISFETCKQGIKDFITTMIRKPFSYF